MYTKLTPEEESLTRFWAEYGRAMHGAVTRTTTEDWERKPYKETRVELCELIKNFDQTDFVMF